MKEVLVIADGVSEQVLHVFRAEVDHLRTLNSKDLAQERGSSIDLFEDFNVKDTDRQDADAYFHLRFRNHQNQDDADHDIIRQFLLESLPSMVVKTCCTSSSMDQPVYLFNESYIVKEPHSNVAFRWHTDANEQLCLQTTPEYFSCWVALDDVNEANGTLYFPESTVVSQWQAIPSSANSSSTVTFEQRHHETDHAAVSSSSSSSSSSSTTDNETRTMPGDDDVGVPINVSAGSIVIFSSSQWHRSSVNTTDQARRVLYVQYSLDVISSTSDGKPLCFAVKCLPSITNESTIIEPPFISSKRRKTTD